MARFIYCPDHPEANGNGFVPAEVYHQWKYGHLTASAAPGYISDHMEPLRHMADGKMYDSKAAFRAATRAAGCIEVGNEAATLTKPREPEKLDRRQRRADIQRATWELKNGRQVR